MMARAMIFLIKITQKATKNSRWRQLFQKISKIIVQIKVKTKALMLVQQKQSVAHFQACLTFYGTYSRENNTRAPRINNLTLLEPYIINLVITVRAKEKMKYLRDLKLMEKFYQINSKNSSRFHQIQPSRYRIQLICKSRNLEVINRRRVRCLPTCLKSKRNSISSS
jgi:hypothetical protein